MNLLRRIGVLLLSFLLLLPLPVRAAENADAEELVQQMLNYYYHYQSSGKTDISRLLDELNAFDPDQAAMWKSIFDYWMYAAEESPKNEIRLPDDLPQDDSLCIVVLGYRLDPYGRILPELIGRLELALNAGNQYPNAHIICTGGGTASEQPNATEAGQMARWLKQQGVDPERITVEDKSMHTIENARFVLRILAADFPQVRKVVLVTSDCHITRSSTLFHTAMELTAHQNGTDPITIAACLGFEAGHEGIAEDILDQTAHVARLSGFEFDKNQEKPPLSILTDISTAGEIQLDVGQGLSLTVMARYDSGFSRDVTAECDIDGFDTSAPESQQIRISYQENGKLLSKTIQILRPVPETESPTQPPSEAPTESIVASGEPAFPFSLPYLLTAIPVVGVLILLLKKKRA